MLWWHLSGAALTIWLSRNWTDQQITAAAFAALQRRGEVHGGDYQAPPDRLPLIPAFDDVQPAPI